MILPVVKLGTLALKTICKPIAKRIKKEAGRHPKFRQSIINMAQANHRLKTNMQRRIYGHATDVAIRPLNEEKAVQAAADLLGELLLFTADMQFLFLLKSIPLEDAVTSNFIRVIHVAGAAVIFEVQRSSKSEARKEEVRRQEMQALKQRDEELAKEIEMLKCKINEMEQIAKGRGVGNLLKFRQPHDTEARQGKSYQSTY